MHSGDIKQDASGLVVKLARALPTADCERLFQLYSEVVSTGGLKEEGIVREIGVNFNPRPARRVQILLEDAKIRDLQILQVAMASCSNEVEKLNILIPLQERAKNISEWSANHTGLLEEDDKIIVAAIVLDDLRHLHMTDRNAEEKIAILKLTEKVILPLLLGEERANLITKISDMLSKQQRRL